MVLVAVFVCPLYFMIRGRWGHFWINTVLYGLACVFLISILGSFLAPFFWFPAALHALWYWRQEWQLQMMTKQAELIASKIGMEGQQRFPPALRFCTDCGRPADSQNGGCPCSPSPLTAIQIERG